jgi:dTDP-4-dehydrorhamnose reductase
VQLAAEKDGTCFVTHHRHERPYASIEFDFWTDNPNTLIDQYQPDWVVFAATVEYHDYDIPRDTFAAAVERIVRACQDCRFVYVSSDAVFDGSIGRYSESVSPAPESEYSHRLTIFENHVRSICNDYCIIRPSYLFGFARGALDDRLDRTRTRLKNGER